MLEQLLEAMDWLPRDVFVSYRTKNRPQANDLARWLRAEGLTVFLDHDSIRAGQDWRKSLERALQTHRVAVCLVTPQYGHSVWTRHELDVLLNQSALLKPVPVVPVLLRGPCPAWLEPLQYITAGRGVGTTRGRVVAAVTHALQQQEARFDLFAMAWRRFCAAEEPARVGDEPEVCELPDDSGRWLQVIEATPHPLLGRMWNAVLRGPVPRHKIDRQRALASLVDPEDRLLCLDALTADNAGLRKILGELGEKRSGNKGELFIRLLGGAG